MGRVAAIGTEVAVRGYGLAGVLVLAAEDAEQVRAAWRGLPDDVDVVILTTAAADTLDLAGRAPSRPLTAVLPR